MSWALVAAATVAAAVKATMNKTVRMCGVFSDSGGLQRFQSAQAPRMRDRRMWCIPTGRKVSGGGGGGGAVYAGPGPEPKILFR